MSFLFIFSINEVALQYCIYFCWISQQNATKYINTQLLSNSKLNLIPNQWYSDLSYKDIIPLHFAFHSIAPITTHTSWLMFNINNRSKWSTCIGTVSLDSIFPGVTVHAYMLVCGIVLHSSQFGTRYSFSTRNIDYNWRKCKTGNIWYETWPLPSGKVFGREYANLGFWRSQWINTGLNFSFPSNSFFEASGHANLYAQ